MLFGNLLPPPWPEATHWGGRIDSEYVGNLMGGRERSTSADLFAYAHLRVDSKPFGLGQGHFYMQVLAALNAHGRRPDGGAGLTQAASNLYAGQQLRLTKFYYTAYRGSTIYRVGMLNISDYFNVVDGAQYLLNSSFCPVPNIGANISATPTIPYSGLGVMGSHRWYDQEIKGAVFQGDPIHPFSGVFSRGSFAILEWDREAQIGRYTLQWQAGAWQYTQRRSLADSTGPAGNGLYFAGAAADDTRGAFFMAARNLRGGDPVTTFMGAGAYFFGLLPHSGEDVTAIGVANVWLRGGGTETVWELSYRMHIANNLYLRPDLQYSPRPSGRYASALVALLRLRWRF
ncbi:carbohydrate porin [Candidatus Igneacidithiobacillus taiwanensis]|uniref:carbohydrate porin n=1 Tax=Candidatus Igneacidithiobacillus taiwanensis TaxID=1945924 RepID=UPI0028A1F5C6|nr:carbohydrate porin [Candidatus Igneacidithiobacillus taiwanensis]